MHITPDNTLDNTDYIEKVGLDYQHEETGFRHTDRDHSLNSQTDCTYIAQHNQHAQTHTPFTPATPSIKRNKVSRETDRKRDREY